MDNTQNNPPIGSGKGHTVEYVTLRDYIDTRIDAIEKAISVAYRSMESRLEGMNEFRNTLKDQNLSFITKAEYQLAHDRLVEEIKTTRDQIARLLTRTEHDASFTRVSEQIKSLELSRAELQGKASQSSVNIAYGISIVGLLVGIIGIILGFVGK